MNQRPRNIPNIGNGLGGLPRRRTPNWTARTDLVDDPRYNNYDKVSLLLPMDGSNNGTTFTDYSPVPKTITRYGDTKTVTAQSKWYGSSGYFDGNGDYLTAGIGVTATGDWTIECWSYPTSASQTEAAICGYYMAGTNGRWNCYFIGGIMSYWVAPYYVYSPNVVVNRWVHVAWVKKDGIVSLFEDGAIVAQLTTVANNLTGAMKIGAYNNLSSAYLGYMQDLRISVGFARYTADFTPPDRGLIGTLSNASGEPIRDEKGAPVARRVFAVPRNYPTAVRTTTSDSSGRYSLTVPYTEHNIIVLDDTARLNDYLISRVLPT